MEIVAIAARHRIPRILAFTLLILATSWLALPVAAEIKVSEWKVPYPDSRPRDPYVDSAGRVWFCGQGDSYIAHLDPRSGSFTRYDLPDNAAPHNLIIDEQDRVWFAANTLPYIGRINASRHSIEHFEMPRGEARDPHTLAFDNVGNIWFTAQWSDQVGRLDMETGEVELFDMPAQGTRPYGIKVDARGRPWVALFGTNSLASIDPQSRRVWTFDLPDPRSRPRRLEIDRSGNIWYGDFSRGKLGRLDPDSGTALWRQPIKAFRGMNILSPIVYNDRLLTSAYGGRTSLFQVDSDGEGMGLSLEWDNKLQGYMSTPVVRNGYAFLHLRNTRLACVNLENGEITWTTTERFGKYMSLVVQGDKILALDQKGKLVLFGANPSKFEKLDERKIADDETWAHLAVAGQELFIRELNAIAAFEWGKPESIPKSGLDE